MEDFEWMIQEPSASGEGGQTLEWAGFEAGAEAQFTIQPSTRLTLDPLTFNIFDDNIITSSTYDSGSFNITNTSTNGQTIERVQLDVSSAVFPDMVFDPFGQAGDLVAKDFTADEGADVTGLISSQLLNPRDGGFTGLELVFDDFQPGETFTFSIDVDPTSTQGLPPPGPNHAASVSGLELIGTQVAIAFSDGTTAVGETYRIPESTVGSTVVVKAGLPPAPALEVLDLPTALTPVTDPNQTVRVSGRVGDTVVLSVIEGALFVNPDDTGSAQINSDFLEANTALAVREYFAVIGEAGYVDIPITLTHSDPKGGINYIAAALTDAQGNTGLVSSTALAFVPSSAPIRIEAEDYVDFFDTTSGNRGRAYRADDVDVQVTADIGGQYNIGWTEAGEWLTYEVTVPTTGRYDLVARVASFTGRKRLQASIDGRETIAQIDGTGGWQSWQSVTLGTFNLTEGTHDLRLDILNGGFNLNYLELVPVPPPPEIRINAGGDTYVDQLGQVWDADAYASGSSTSYEAIAPIAGTEEDVLYQTGRRGDRFSYEIPVTNGTYNVSLGFAATELNLSTPAEFQIRVEDQVFAERFDIGSQAGDANTALVEFIRRVSVEDGALTLEFEGRSQGATISTIEAIKVDPDELPELFVELDVPEQVVDYDGDGSEIVQVFGSESHAREFGEVLTRWVWTRGTTVVATGIDIEEADLAIPLNVGQHTLSLTIQDSQSPAAALTGSKEIRVDPIDAVAGVLTRYYQNPDGIWDGSDETGSEPVLNQLDELPAIPDFVEIRPNLSIQSTSGTIGNSPFSDDVVVVMDGEFTPTTTGFYDFILPGTVDSQFYLDYDLDGDLDRLVDLSNIQLNQGSPYRLQSRFAFDTADFSTAEVLVQIDDAPIELLAPDQLTHDQTNLSPFINEAPLAIAPTPIPTTGNKPIRLNGVGFFSADSSVPINVYWDGQLLDEGAFTVDRGATITIDPPPGDVGTVIPVVVETPNGVSNPASFIYEEIVPIEFATSAIAGTDGWSPFGGPTQGTWGADGRLYVGSVSGEIKIYTFDDDYQVTDVQSITTLQSLSNPNILGIAFNPFDTPENPTLYVAHSQLFANGGADIDESNDISPYSGQVSILEGADFSTLTPLITGLPASNHDHGVNGLTFTNEGDLLIAVGGVTNAGVKWPEIGDLPESPFSAAILKANLSNPDFNGTIEYEWSSTPPSAANAAPNNQVYGNDVNVSPVVDIDVYASGFRNAFDLVWTTDNQLYTVDNGPNILFGPASTGLDTTGPTVGFLHPDVNDELNRVDPGGYYGHPNRNRGRFDARQAVFYNGETDASIPGIYTAPLAILDASTNGIDEYRATTFNSQMRGNILAQDWNDTLYSIRRSPDGTQVEAIEEFTDLSSGLDVLTGPGGVILGIDYSDGNITVSKPIDAAVSGVTAYDIFPWRSPATGGQPFVIGGANFSGNIADTTVIIGDKEATITSVSETRIRGILPAQLSPLDPDNNGLLDITVISHGENSVMTDAFRLL
ncbi:MAG: malectin domain-containing carbohydrate-binding protein [Elainellaceae cyanobacterium]